MFERRFLAAVALGGAAVAGCSGADAGERSTTQEQAVTGTVTLDASCAGSRGTFLAEAARYERTVVASPVFEACMDAAMNGNLTMPDGSVMGPYWQCSEKAATGPDDPAWASGDPHANLAQQTALAVSNARSHNDLSLFCANDTIENAYGYSPLGVLDVGAGAEEVAIVDRFIDAYQQDAINDPEHALGYDFIAGVIAHEVSHNHNYHHGGGPAEDCGYSAGPPGPPVDSDVAWRERHTVPYLEAACVQLIIGLSAKQCGDLAFCGQDQLHLMSYFNGSPPLCYCAPDPSNPSPPASSGGGGGEMRCGGRGLPPCLAPDP